MAERYLDVAAYFVAKQWRLRPANVYSLVVRVKNQKGLTAGTSTDKSALPDGPSQTRWVKIARFAQGKHPCFQMPTGGALPGTVY